MHDVPDERARSLRRVAIHEYAHCHVARAFGIAGRVQIAARTGHASDSTREHFSGAFVPVLPMIACHAAQVIALAGICADARLAQATAPTAASVCAGLALGESTLSEGDAIHAGAYGETHIAEALLLVGEAWHAIERDAEVHAAALECERP